MNEFEIGSLKIHVFPAATENSPVVYLHGLDGFALDVEPTLEDAYDGKVSLVVITIPYEEWSNLLAPWSTPDGWPQYVACTGGAPEYIKTFTGQIVPKAESFMQKPGERVLAGYSLAGLFAIWSLFETDLFDKIACASGSLWFPGFEKWFFTHQMKRIPEYVYFSISDEEFNSENKYLEPVKPTTIAVRNWFDRQGVETTFVLDPGDHYQDVLQRTSAAIFWVLNH